MKKRLFAILLTVFMIASLLPTGAFAAEAVTYIERSWDGSKVVETVKTVTEYTLIDENYQIDYTWNQERNRVYATLNEGWYVVKGNNNYTFDDGRLELYIGGDVKIILTDGSTLSLGCILGGNNDNERLTIYGQSLGDGALIANPTDDGESHSGIGGGMVSVTIHGGNITAQSADGGAGIGGTDVEGDRTDAYVDGCDVTIYGGTVKAAGSYGDEGSVGYGGAGIGGGGSDPRRS